jgi:hypothetical protein
MAGTLAWIKETFETPSKTTPLRTHLAQLLYAVPFALAFMELTRFRGLVILRDKELHDGKR